MTAIAEHRSMTIPRAVALPTAIAFSATLAACDGSIAVKGRVYQPDGASSGADSRIVINKVEGLLPPRLQPLGGATVILSKRTHGGSADVDEFASRTTTDSDGTFTIDVVTAPFASEATLIVQHPGYKPVRTTFRSADTTWTYAIAILAKHAGQEAQ